jgi:hypothetical protein
LPTGKAVVAAVVVVVGAFVVVVVGAFVVVVVGRDVVVTVGAVVVVVKIGIVVVVEKNGNVVVVVGDFGLLGRWPTRKAGEVFDLDDSSLAAKGKFVTFDVVSMPFRNGEEVDEREGCFLNLDLVFTVTANDREATVVESLGALNAGRISCVVPGVTTFSAADASSATTPRSIEDATRSVNS